MDVRPASLTNKWYPSDPSRLAREIDGYLSHAQVQPPAGRIVGIVAPHAGLRYAGPVAAYAYACLRGLQIDIVAVVGPMHTPAPASILTTAHDAYATPFGAVVVDTEAVRRLSQTLRQNLGYGLRAVRTDSEHSVETELPFLQRVLGTFQLLPVMLRDQHIDVAEALGHALAASLQGRRTLLVASSDLSHYYPPLVARMLDMEMLRRLAAFDPQGILTAEEQGAGAACGSASIAAVLWAARDLGANHVTVLRYGTSGDAVGEVDWVVGYGAATIWEADTRLKHQ